jgi:hypothetical protein
MRSIVRSDRMPADVWIALRRPLLTVAMLGCAMSLMTSGRLTLRIAGPAAVCWSFVPLLEIASLAAVCGRGVSAQLIDRFFEGQWPWLLWLTVFAAMWGLAPARFVIGRTGYPTVWYVLAVVAAVWSGRLDYRFSRTVLKRTRAGAARDLAVERLICWPAALAIFLWSSGVQTVAAGLGL